MAGRAARLRPPAGRSAARRPAASRRRAGRGGGLRHACGADANRLSLPRCARGRPAPAASVVAHASEQDHGLAIEQLQQLALEACGRQGHAPADGRGRNLGASAAGASCAENPLRQADGSLLDWGLPCLGLPPAITLAGSFAGGANAGKCFGGRFRRWLTGRQPRGQEAVGGGARWRHRAPHFRPRKMTGSRGAPRTSKSW